MAQADSVMSPEQIIGLPFGMGAEAGDEIDLRIVINLVLVGILTSEFTFSFPEKC